MHSNSGGGHYRWNAASVADDSQRVKHPFGSLVEMLTPISFALLVVKGVKYVRFAEHHR